MEREQDFPAERALQAFTSLGQALEAYSLALGSHTDSMTRASEAIDHANAVAASETGKQAVDPITEKYRSDRARFEQQETEFRQVASLLANTGGILLSGSSGVEGAQAASESARIRKEMIDVQEAFDRGLIDMKETERALKKLNRNLALSQGQEALATGAGSKEGGSRWSKLVNSAAPAVIEGAKKGVQSLAGQISGVGSGLMGTLGKALPVAGGLAIFGLMLWGVLEADRLRAEFGEMVNLAVAAGGSAHSRGLAWMGGFQERAQKFYGISRREVQRVFKDFVEAGISMDDTFKVFDRSLGEVGQNAITLALAADRHFELSTGTTSRAVTQAVTQYGMELGKAADVITNIEFEASHAGFGVGKMVTWTMQASANVRHLGIGIEEVASAAFQMRKFYEKAGLDSEKWSQDAVSEMIGGIQGMGVGREIWAAEKLGLGKGIQGRQALREGLLHRDPTMLRKLATLYKRDAEKAGGGNEMVGRFYLEKLGFGVEGSKAVMELGDDTEEDAKVHDKKKDDRRKLRNSFREESMKVSELQKRKNEMLAGFAKAGQGLLQMLTGFMALVIVSVKGLPYYFLGTKDEAERARAMMERQITAISAGAQTFLLGGKQALGAIWDTIAPMIQPMLRAWEFSPYIGRLTKEEEALLNEVDPIKRRDNTIALLARYGAATPENVRALYMRPIDLPLTMAPITPGGPAVPVMLGPGSKPPPKSTTPSPQPSPPSEQPGGATKTPPAPRFTPAPIPVNIGGQTIIVGSLDVPRSRHVIEVQWNAPMDEMNLVADVTVTKVG